MSQQNSNFVTLLVSFVAILKERPLFKRTLRIPVGRSRKEMIPDNRLLMFLKILFSNGDRYTTLSKRFLTPVRKLILL